MRNDRSYEHMFREMVRKYFDNVEPTHYKEAAGGERKMKYSKKYFDKFTEEVKPVKPLDEEVTPENEAY